MLSKWRVTGCDGNVVIFMWFPKWSKQVSKKCFHTRGSATWQNSYELAWKNDTTGTMWDRFLVIELWIVFSVLGRLSRLSSGNGRLPQEVTSL